MAVVAYPELTRAQQALNNRRYVEAARIAMNHVRAHPTDARGLGLLGSAAMKMGALRQAEQFLREALTHSPGNAHGLRELASCLHQQERLDEALRLFEQIAQQEPGDSQASLMTCLILDKLGRADEARSRIEQLVERFPDNTNVWLAYGLNLRASGRTEDSVAAYRRAIEIDPERGDAWWGIASIKKNVFTDSDVEAMQAALATAIDVDNVSPLHFALARAMHERRRYEEAFHHYSEANRLWAEAIDYKASELTGEVDQAERIFDQPFFAGREAGGDPSQAPIFIVSLPRSGSTLLEQMLGSHPEIEPLGELPHIPALLRLAMESAMRRGISSVPQAIAALSAADRDAFGADYMRRASLHRTGRSRRFVDKLPHNWSNTLFIQQILPNAKIIDIRRNAVDCCFSNFSHSFSRAHASSFALEDIGRTYRDYVRFMDHLDSVSPNMVHHVRYERLVAEPERELSRILDHLGLPWDDACLKFYQSDRSVRTPSAEQVRRPLNRAGIGAWKPYEQWLEPLFEVLGPLAKTDR